MFTQSIFELIRETSTNLPADVAEALIQARNLESKNFRSKLSLAVILKNIELAQKQKTPICQDTGFPTFFVKANPAKWKVIEKAILAATKKATQEGVLRDNSVEILSGKNVGNLPKIEFEISQNSEIEIALLLKGGGSENVSAQFSLPAETDSGLAGRDLDGVKKVVLGWIKKTGGKGCSPAIISIVIGGDRAAGLTLAKKKLLQKIGTENSNPELAKLEAEIIRAANATKIGAMGLGGATTLLDCKIATLNRHPASYFVTLAYSCWATRRGKISLDSKGEFLHDDFSKKVLSENLKLTKIKKIQLPISEKEVRKLRVGEVVAISGKLFTARDQVHALVSRQKLPKNLSGLGVFHCGPIMMKKGKNWRAVAAGPTTSARLDSFTSKFLEKTGVRVFIGKGGMGVTTQKALKKFGAVYLHAIGGCGAFYASSIKKVCGVDFLEEFGMPEALWEIEVEDFLAVVGMDAKGGKL
ncbi:FumA C-terminus/TtdB family hydratase beta subunit [Candidatus Gracilibacteria bacterium]|nr:FumA C-terminus/TtdB family hydratase beta subunit [Candidatus Gracilibacteria bacterium]MCF7856143.1 FumA C-terminus/TtdB family hydratase beta subunit [Candidatus Gracilibacteria bacterium]MCF7896609.1 FumA C-terminus/TtdB family hydratase beta subunit [Candidatus Gracilibacteria bacterium]